MIQSMTGYGGSERTWNKMSFRVEVRSLNHRFCDVNVRLPEGLARLDNKVRKAISERFSRGKFDISISIKVNKVTETVPILDVNSIKRYKQVLKELSRAFGVNFNIREDIGFSDLWAIKDLILPPCVDYDRPEVDRILIEMVNKSLDRLRKMRAREGNHIYRDIIKRIGRIDAILKKIKKLKPTIMADLKKRYMEKIKEFSGLSGLDRDRLYQEIAIITEKMDITEEIVRTESHIKQFRERLRDGAVIGRTLDFLLQEIYREINTMSSKAGDATVSQMVVDMKGEVERIREQVQNVE